MRALVATYRFGKFTLQTGDRRLSSDGHEIYLRPKTYDTLLYLLERHGHLVTKKELLDALWTDVQVTENALTRCIKEARAALGDDVQNPAFLRTIPRLGYQFVADVERLDELTNEEVVEEEFQAVRLVTTEEESDSRPSEPVWAADAMAVSGAQPSLPPKALNKRTVPVRALVGLVVVAVLVVGLAALKQRVLRRPAATPDTAIIHSVAVLPLADLSGKAGDEYFADGMTEALITELGKVRALRVISWQSVKQFKGSTKAAPQIARELGVDALVEGSALRSPDKVRITAQLVEANPERHLWSESYERDLSDVISLQREIAQAVVREIQVSLTPAEQLHLAKAAPVSPEAYEAYLKGLYHLDRFSVEDTRKAREWFQRAIEADPLYAPAYAGLAHTRTLPSYGAWDSPIQQTYETARNLTQKAIALDGTLPEAHFMLAGIMEEYDWDWAGAERELKQAISINPSFVLAHEGYAELLSILTRHDEAVREAKLALQLDPASPHRNGDLGYTLYWARQYDQAIEQLQKALALDPNYSRSYFGLGRAYLEKGMGQKALEALQNGDILFYAGRRPSNLLGYAYGTLGETAKALKIAHRLEALQAQGDPDAACDLARVYVGLGDKDRALQLLEAAYRQRYPDMMELKVDPEFDRLRSDPRFQNLLQRMNFPQ